MEKITIKEVAEAAGVSVMTVSRVLNNRPDVSSTTRKRIRRIIEELGYAPNLMASGLRQGRSNTLGAVATGIEYYGPSRTVVGIERQADALGYSLLLSLVHSPQTDYGEDALESLIGRQVDGIIWAVPEIGSNRDWLSKRVSQIATPVVFLSIGRRERIMTAAVNNYIGGKLATAHLLEQGNQQIGIITGPMNWWEARQRAEGWRDTLHDAGFRDFEERCAEGDWSAASGEAAMYSLLEHYPSLDAVFASNDQMALGALKAARRAGRSVPNELAIVGFDDSPESAFLYPPLTTVRQDLIQVGQQAVLLLDRILEARRNEAELEPQALIVTPELIVRESSIRS